MRVKEGFVIRDIMGQTVVIPTGKASEEFTGMVKLNDTGRDIWEAVSGGMTEEEIIDMISEKYEVSKENSKSDVKKFISNMEAKGFFVQ